MSNASDPYPKAARRGSLNAACCLTEHDASLLKQAIAINGGVNTPFGRAVVDKLDNAERRSSIPCNYVKLNSLVTFEVDGRAALSRILVHWDKFRVPRLHLSLHTPWGMTLLGMKAGEEAIVDWGGDVPEKIKIVSVIPQPVALASPPVRSHQHTRSPDPLEQRR